MHLAPFPAPPFYENAYLLACSDTGRAVAVDPGDGAGALIETVRTSGVTLEAVLLTHAHLDHISGVHLVKAAFDVPVRLHPGDRFLYDAIVEQGRMFGLDVLPQPPIDGELAGGDRFTVGRLSVRVHETPGHSPGGVVFEVTDAAGAVSVLAGDTLFAGSIGRTDLPGGDYSTLIESIRRVLMAFDDGVPVFPGHGEPTTVGRERRDNPFLR
jgi:hydroxyacylglutathione hydrolase